MQLLSQLHSILHREVLLPFKGAFQLIELMVREGGPRLSYFLTLPHTTLLVTIATASSCHRCWCGDRLTEVVATNSSSLPHSEIVRTKKTSERVTRIQEAWNWLKEARITA